MTVQGLKALAIAAVPILFILAEPMPLPTVAVLIGAYKFLLGVTGPIEVSRFFISDSLLFILMSTDDCRNDRQTETGQAVGVGYRPDHRPAG